LLKRRDLPGFSLEKPRAERREVPEIYAGVSHLVGSALLIGLSFTSIVSLYHYYTNPAYARDDYRAIVHFIKAVGGPEDAIILNAEGQQDIFNYYFEQEPPVNISIHPLPRQRPLNETATREEMHSIANTAATVYGVYWATRQADPSGLIETWLDTHLYKATDQWYGNVRLVSYAAPQTNNNLTPVDVYLGDSIRLTGYGLASPQIAPGDILQLALQWQTTETLSDNYTVFIQVLDPANHLAGQRDASPLTATANWPVNQPINDAHGVFIEPGTPPGRYRLIVGLYHRQTGQRLPVAGENGKDFVELAPIEIIRPAAPLPREAFDIQVPLDAPLGDITIVGYDLYKLGQQDALYTLLHPGDPVHLTLYWSPIETIPPQLTVQVVDNAGNPTPLTFTIPLEENKSFEGWSNGEIIRTQADFFLANLPPGSYRLAFNTEFAAGPVFSQTFVVK
jgi:mannosyltransferase